ncbi:MAG: hypothetical protein PVSMB5_31840 [Ktedonobacteraceae bacterium]
MAISLNTSEVNEYACSRLQPLYFQPLSDLVGQMLIELCAKI